LGNLEFREGWATVALMLLTLLCVAWAIQAAAWTAGLSILPLASLVGGVFGILLTKSRTPSRLAHALSLLAGFTWAAYLTSRFLASALDIPLELAVSELSQHLESWLVALVAGKNSAGEVFFLFSLSLLMWLLAYLCAWAIFRWQQVWWGIIPSGVVLIINLTSAPKNLTGFLIAFVMFSLLLVVRTSLASYQQEWHVTHVRYNPELVGEVLRAGLAVVALAIALAWIAPSALASRPVQQTWSRVSAPWRDVQDEINRLFKGLNYRRDPALIPTFRRAVKFGGPVNLSDAPILDITAATGRYWRAGVFHEYTSDGWLNTDTDTILIAEDQQTITIPPFELRREVTQTVTLRHPLGLQSPIIAAGQPLRSNIPLRAVVSLSPQEEQPTAELTPTILIAAPGDPSFLYPQTELRAGDSYQVVSSLTRVDQESLRQAGTDYPPWIVPRYLQLPDSLPPRVTRLAEQLTAEHETAYDKARAIEDYLRSITYNEQISAPAAGQDGVDYFLFDVQEGYCDYYASAMVVMLRSIGVPARYVRGYSQGSKEEGSYHIQERDSHAWPEVYFPAFGWIEFEPTAGEPVLVRPRGPRPRPYDEQARQMDPGDFETIPDVTPASLWQRVGRKVGLALCGLALVLVGLALTFVHRRRRLRGLSAAERVYHDLVEWVRRLLQISPLAHQTPYEYAQVVSRRVPQGQAAVRRIAEMYVEERFGGKTIPAQVAAEAWRQARPALWHSGLRHWATRLRNLRLRLRPVPPPPPLWHKGQD